MAAHRPFGDRVMERIVAATKVTQTPAKPTLSGHIERIARKQSLLTVRDVELAVKVMLEHMATCLAEGGRSR